MMFGNDSIEEPSLFGAAPRRMLDFNEVHSALQVLIQDYIYQEADSAGKSLDEVHDKLHTIMTKGFATWDYEVMALSQHYGIPTHGLDITASLEIALWFATNKINTDKNGYSYYSLIEENQWPTDPKKWPIIFFILPVTESIEPSIISGLGDSYYRPSRQKAAFFMGANGAHQNRLAEALVCIARLRPGLEDRL